MDVTILKREGRPTGAVMSIKTSIEPVTVRKNRVYFKRKTKCF